MTLNQLIKLCKKRGISLDTEICLPGAPPFILQKIYLQTNSKTIKSKRFKDIEVVQDYDDDSYDQSFIVLDNKYGD